jgi:hypothetical protein
MTDIIRDIMVDLNAANISQAKAIVADMVSYFNRQTDHDQIKTAIKQRYGQSIKRSKDPNSNKTVETYVKGDFGEQVDAGLIEAIAIGFGNKVVNAKATLFTEKGQTFSLVHPEESRNTEEADKLLLANRKVGGFRTEMTRCDKKSVQTGSCAILMSFHRNHMTYQTLTADVFTAYFNDFITEDGQQRSVDTTDLEDASLILIRLHQVDVETWNYLAIFGRSDIYPSGRYVEFQGAQEVTQVPGPYEDGANEFEIDGVMCNPLSHFANQPENADLYLPEYPIAIIKGGTTDAEVLMPTTESLYVDSKEFDTAASHTLGASQIASRGTNAVTRTEQGMGKSLPKSLHGDVAFESGIEFKHHQLNSVAAKDALLVLKDLMIELASGYAVPDYMVTSEDHAIEASSGVALQVKTRPLKKDRENRIEINAIAVERVFTIEKSLIKMFSTAPESDKQTLFECVQTWEAGELKLPENKKEAAERIISLMNKGILDTIAGIREYYQLSTDAEAIEIYETMQERKGKYDSLIDEPEPKKNLGLKGRNNFRQQ